MTLGLYLARRFGASLALVAGAFALLLGLIELIEQVRDLADEPGAQPGDALRMTLLTLPARIHEITPLIVLLATLALFLALSRSSEMVVVRAAGRSALAALRAPVAVMAVLGALLVAGFNPIVAATSRQAEVLDARIEGAGSVLSLSDEGLWLRQSQDGTQTVIRAAGASFDGTALSGVTFFDYATGEGVVRRTDAARARLVAGEWRLEDAILWDLTLTNPETQARRVATATIPTDLTPERILDGFGDPRAVPIWELPAFVAQLERAGFAARTHRMHLWSELASPAFLVAMVLLGAAFTVRHTRLGRTGAMVGSALGAGFALYFVKDLAAILGTTGRVPILAAALVPPLAAIALAVALLLHLEDG